MLSEASEVLNFQQNLYSFVVNIAGFLKTLKKKGVENIHTQNLAILAGDSHKLFEHYTINKNDDILNNVCGNIQSIIKILIAEFEDIGNDVIHEKADLYIDANNLLKKLN